MKKGLRMARVAAILLAIVSFVGIKDSGVQASDSQGLKGSYIGIGSAPKDADVTKQGDAIVLGRKGIVDYRASVDASTKTNSNGEGVAWKIDNNGLFSGGYGSYAVQDYSTALGTYSGAVEGSTALGAGVFARKDSLAVGKNAYASFRAVSAGVGAQASDGVAIGYGATAGKFYKYVQGTSYQDPEWFDGCVAIGNNAIATGGIALGAKAKSGSLFGTAVGNSASVAYSGVALGNGATVKVDTGVALGVYAVADRARGTYGYVPFADDTKKDSIPTSDAALASAISAKDSVKNFTTTYANEISEYNKLNRSYYEAEQNGEKQKDIMLVTMGSKDPAEQKQYTAAEEAYNQYRDEAVAITKERNKWTDAHSDFMKALCTQSASLLTFKSTDGAISVGVTGAETRQITNVAAGSQDTDAVNLAQLKRVVSETGKKANLDASNLTPDQVSNWQIALGIDQNAVGNVDAITLSEGGHVKIDTTYNDDKSRVNYKISVDEASIKDAVMPEVNQKLDGKADRDASNLTDMDVKGWKDTLGVSGLTNYVGDLQNKVNGLDNRVNRLDTRLDRVGAGAAALAALHPQDFDPEEKWDFAIGGGHYGTANALAVGAFYRPNAKTMLSIGGSTGGGENLMNVGLSIKLGKGSPYAGYSKAALTTVIADQKVTIEKLEKQIEEIMKQLAELKK